MYKIIGNFILLTMFLAQMTSASETVYLQRLKELSTELDYFLLEILVYPLMPVALQFDSSDAVEFYEFTKHARNATPQDCEDCLAYLDQASAKERALILVVLHFSQNDKYLPIISQYCTDNEVAILRFEFSNEKIEQIECWKPWYNIYLHRPSSDPKEWPWNRMVRTLGKMNDSLTKSFLIRITTNETNRGANWDYYYSRKGKDTTVADFANTILDVWECFPSGVELPVQWQYYGTPYKRSEPFSSDYWDEFKNRKNFAHRWWVKYMIEVESRPLDEYDVASKEFFEKVRDLPPLECMLVLRTVDYQGHIRNNFIERIDGFSPGWRSPYHHMPKEKLIEMFNDTETGKY